MLSNYEEPFAPPGVNEEESTRETMVGSLERKKKWGIKERQSHRHTKAGEFLILRRLENYCFVQKGKQAVSSVGTGRRHRVLAWNSLNRQRKSTLGALSSGTCWLLRTEPA